MRFEKLSNDKIRIILDLQDLEDNDIDYQSFMSNSSDSQKLFMEILDEAEEQIGFTTKDYKLMIEALATIDGDFIITVTRSLPDFDITSAYKKMYGQAKSAMVKLNPEKNTIRIYSYKTVVEEVEDSDKQISLQDARNIKKWNRNK